METSFNAKHSPLWSSFNVKPNKTQNGVKDVNFPLISACVKYCFVFVRSNKRTFKAHIRPRADVSDKKHVIKLCFPNEFVSGIKLDQ